MQRYYEGHIIAVHVSKSAPGGSSPERIVAVGITASTFKHPISIPVGVKCVNPQAQSGGRSSAKVSIPESLTFLGAANGEFAAWLIDKIFEGLVESGKQRISTVMLVG
jgi:hypothetical protein